MSNYKTSYFSRPINDIIKLNIFQKLYAKFKQIFIVVYALYYFSKNSVFDHFHEKDFLKNCI